MTNNQFIKRMNKVVAKQNNAAAVSVQFILIVVICVLLRGLCLACCYTLKKINKEKITPVTEYPAAS
jgi:CHASE3 domain sensor protein